MHIKRPEATSDKRGQTKLKYYIHLLNSRRPPTVHRLHMYRGSVPPVGLLGVFCPCLLPQEAADCTLGEELPGFLAYCDVSRLTPVPLSVPYRAELNNNLYSTNKWQISVKEKQQKLNSPRK